MNYIILRTPIKENPSNMALVDTRPLRVCEHIYGGTFIIDVQLIHVKSTANMVFLLCIRFQYHAANSTGLVATALQVTILRSTIMIDDREKWSNNVVIVSCLYQLLALIA